MRARTTLLPTPQETSAPANPTASSSDQFNFQLSTFDFLSVSPLFAILTRPVTANPFTCHAYTKPPGWMYTPSPRTVSSFLHAVSCQLPTVNPFISFVLILLRTLVQRANRYLPSFQSNPNSCGKTPWVGGGTCCRLSTVDCQLDSAALFCIFLQSPKRYAAYFQTLPGSLHKTPGGMGVQTSELHQMSRLAPLFLRLSTRSTMPGRSQRQGGATQQITYRRLPAGSGAAKMAALQNQDRDATI
jgi:hypothetical protein